MIKLTTDDSKGKTPEITESLDELAREHPQKRAVGVKEGPQEVVGGEGDVEVDSQLFF